MHADFNKRHEVSPCCSQVPSFKDGEFKGIFARFYEYAGKADLNECY